MGTMKNDFTLSLNTKTDTSEVQKAIDRLQRKKPILKIDIETNDIRKKMDSLDPRIKKIGDEFQRTSTKIQTGLSGIYKGKQLENIVKVTEQFKTKLGETQERVTLLTKTAKGNLVPIQSSLDKMANAVTKVNETITQSEATFGKYKGTLTTTEKVIQDTANGVQTIVTKERQWIDENNMLHTSLQTFSKDGSVLTPISAEMEKVTASAQKLSSELQIITKVTKTSNETITRGKKSYEGLVTTINTVNGKGERLTTVITEYINAAGMAVKETKKLDAYGKQLGRTMTEVSSSMQKADTSSKGLASSFAETVGKVGKFYLATMPIMAVQTTITEAKEAVFDFDKAMTEFKKVSDLSGDSLDEYTKKLGDLGTEVARTRTEMVSSATEFKKSGFSEEDSLGLSKIAEMYRNVADAKISSADSAGFVISQMKAFGDETEEFAQHSIDAINNVSNNMSVSSSDISTALSKTSSAMGALGNSYEETIGLVTAG